MFIQVFCDEEQCAKRNAIRSSCVTTNFAGHATHSRKFLQRSQRVVRRKRAGLVQLGVEREPVTVLVRFLRFLVDFGKGFAHNLAIIAKKS